MKAFVAAVLFIAVASVGAYYVLDSYQRSGSTAFTSATGVRLGDPGNNLIGS